MEWYTKRKSWDNTCKALVNNYEDSTVGEVEKQSEFDLNSFKIEENFFIQEHTYFDC